MRLECAWKQKITIASYPGKILAVEIWRFWKDATVAFLWNILVIKKHTRSVNKAKNSGLFFSEDFLIWFIRAPGNEINSSPSQWQPDAYNIEYKKFADLAWPWLDVITSYTLFFIRNAFISSKGHRFGLKYQPQSPFTATHKFCCSLPEWYVILILVISGRGNGYGRRRRRDAVSQLCFALSSTYEDDPIP